MCGCGANAVIPQSKAPGSREMSTILNKWIIDNLNRKLLIQEPIYDTYDDIIGYITKNENGNIIRIFSKNIKIIID
jgi:hypothetical protein